MENKLKLGFLFGAGAECCYGLPTGNEFAIRLFLQGCGSNELINQIKKSKNKEYEDWLPGKKVRTTGFTASTVHKLITDCLHTNREKLCGEWVQKYGKEVIAGIKDELELNVDYDCDHDTPSGGTDMIWGNYRDIVHELRDEIISLAKGLTEGKASGKTLKAYKGMLKFLYGLVCFAYGHSFVDEVNNLISSEIDSSICWLDCGDIFHVDSGEAFVKDGWDIIKEYKNADGISGKASYKEFKNLFSCLLDYRALIDEYWHYLYTPKEEWAKFCKIAIFLYDAVAIFDENKESENGEEKEPQEPGLIDYYRDIDNCQDIEIVQIATTNYTSLSKSKIPSYKQDVMHLNGSLEKMYDPYKNEVIEKADAGERFVVPWIYTQSGTKPMTDISIMEKYVDTSSSHSSLS